MASLLNKNSKIAVTSRSFSKDKELIKYLKSKFKHVKLIAFLDEADAAIIGIEPVTKKVLHGLPKLKVISKYGVGTNNLDIGAIRERGIRLAVSPGSNSQSVAEYALYLMLLSLRKNFNNLEEITQKIWSQKKGRELYNSKIGIIGFGNIGKKLALLLKPFHVEIMIFDLVKIKLNKSQQSYIKQVSFTKLLKESDIISIHLPLVKDTINFLGKKEFAALKEDAIIINTSRGGIVSENELHSFLNKNPEAFGAFDVFKKEPIFDSKLFKLPNFFASSHRASLTNQGIHNMGIAAIDGLLKK
jgi:D-3-phosphoglycerate dehydrogenase